MTIKIYAILDPRHDLVMYVGRTTNLEYRAWEHQRDATNADTESIRYANIHTWMHHALNAAVDPQYTILETVEDLPTAYRAEHKWINHYAKLAHPILNNDRLEYPDETTIIDQYQTLIQIWRQNDCRLPFKAKRSIWLRTYVIVQEIYDTDGNYGKAKGQYIPGQLSGHRNNRVIKSPGVYDWTMISDQQADELSRRVLTTPPAWRTSADQPKD